MKTRNMKKMLAVALSASMVAGMSVPVLAAATTPPAGGNVDAPIYSFNIVDVVVPTTYAVAFNPEGLDVKNGTNTVQDQILSKKFGILNKSNRDKIVGVSLTIEDLNEDSGITFVDSATDVSSAKPGEYKIHLTAVPADTTEVKVGNTPASATGTTTAADLADVTMTDAASGSEVTLGAGENTMEFFLEKAVYTAKSGSEVTLGNSDANNVKDNFELTSVAANGKGITGFTFGGEMNVDAEWYELTQGIKITAVYTSENAPVGAAATAGTGAVYDNPAPKFSTGATAGTINYTTGKSGDDAELDSITSITLVGAGNVDYEVYKALDGLWGAATDDNNGLITLDALCLAAFARDFPNDALKEATVTYETKGGVTKTVKVDVKLR